MRSTQLLLFAALESQMLISALAQNNFGHPGICMRSLYLNFTSMPQEWSQCRNFCKAVEGSTWYTYNTHNSHCLCWPTCEELSTSDCPTCISDDLPCSYDECFVVNARVHGIVISTNVATDAKECARQCNAHGACQWFTYDSEDQSCLFTRDKEFISDCTNCTSGRECCGYNKAIDVIPQSICKDINIDESGALLASPGYPNNYANNEVCQFTVTAPLGTTITAKFVKLDLEASCIDYIKLYDGDSKNSIVLASVCDSEIRGTEYTTSGQQLYIYFKTDGSVEKEGYVMELTVNSG